MRRRTLEEKLEAIRLGEAGNSPRSVSDRLHIGHHQTPREQSKSIMKRLPKEECEKEMATVNYLYISINNLIKVLIFQLLYLSLQQESPLKK